LVGLKITVHNNFIELNRNHILFYYDHQRERCRKKMKKWNVKINDHVSNVSELSEINAERGKKGLKGFGEADQYFVIHNVLKCFFVFFYS